MIPEEKVESENILPVKKKNYIVIFIAVSLAILVGGVGIRWYLTNYKDNQIPANWKTYKNVYYGYAFRYSPEIILEPDIYGGNEGEDLGVTVHYMDQTKLEKNGYKNKEEFQKAIMISRGVLISEDYDKWYFRIHKPYIENEDTGMVTANKKCKPGKTTGGLVFYECPYENSWDFNIYLKNYQDKKILLVISLKNRDLFSKEEQKSILTIMKSFTQNNENKMLAYPTKIQLFPWIKMYWCDHQNDLIEEYADGVMHYGRYSVVTKKAVLGGIYLTKPRSFCEAPISELPYLNTDCPFLSQSDLIDNHALGESSKYAVCGGTLPADSIEDSCDGITSVFNSETAKIKLAKGWKYSTNICNKEVVAVPLDWKTQESPIGSCKPDFVEYRDPNMQVVVTLTNEKMLTRKEATEKAVNLGKFECGKYATCELIREKVTGEYQYDYYLLLIGQPNIIAKPNRITVKFFDSENKAAEAKLLPVIDEIAQSAVFLYDNEIYEY